MLESILESTRLRLQDLAARRRDLETAAAAAATAPSMREALTKPGLSVIAEVKRRSPSAGDIAPDLDPVTLAGQYVSGGAIAISVLTEPDHFGGSNDDLVSVRQAVEVPILRKDFVLDPLQLVEARALGAAAALLIVSILDQPRLVEMIDAACEVGIAVLVEVHDESELERALAAGAEIVGINNRDLGTFEVDTQRAIGISDLIPSGVVGVAESGIRSPETAKAMAIAGYQAVLVGQAAAEAPDPEAFVASLVGVGR